MDYSQTFIHKKQPDYPPFPPHVIMENCIKERNRKYRMYVNIRTLRSPITGKYPRFNFYIPKLNLLVDYITGMEMNDFTKEMFTLKDEFCRREEVEYLKIDIQDLDELKREFGKLLDDRITALNAYTDAIKEVNRKKWLESKKQEAEREEKERQRIEKEKKIELMKMNMRRR